MPNNREWAVLFWVVVVAVCALTQREVRSSAVQVLRSAAKPKILIPMAFMGAWVAMEVWSGAQIALWVPDLSTNTAIWFIACGLVLFANFDEASKRPDFFRRKAVAAFAPVVLMGALLDAFVLPLPAEIILQLVLAVLVMLAVVAGADDRHQQVKKLASGLIGLIGLVLIAFAVIKTIVGWDGLDKGDLLRQAVLPGWLTIGLLPFIYAVALYASYEFAFMRVDRLATSISARRRSKIALLTGFHVKATEIASFAGFWPQRITAASSFAEARGVIQEFRTARREVARAQVEAQAQLLRYSGVDGVDEDGRRSDRREFSETANALRWLATCMMGWCRRENRYPADLLERLGDDFTRQGLAKPSGITMYVAEDGQAWYAWRRTMTGWCFAIGAAGPPPDQWEYDGPEPPGGFPGKDHSWGTQAFSNEANLNW